MRNLMLVGISAIALSGCSWVGAGNGMGGYGHGMYGHNMHGGSMYGQRDPYANNYRHHKPNKDYDKPGSYSVHAGIGTGINVGSSAFTGNESTFAPAAFQPNQVAMKNAYKAGIRGDGGVNYKLTKNNSLTLTGFYEEAKGKNVNLGTTAAGIVTGQMGKYKSYGFEAGMRHDLGKKRLPVLKEVKPYLSGAIGIANIEDIALNDINGLGAVGIADGSSRPFFRGRLIPTASGLVGVEKAISKNTFLALETGIRYAGELSPDTRQIGIGGPLSQTNQDGANWTVPLQIRGRYAF